MNSPLPPKDENDPTSKCFARSVLDALSEEPTLEAVTINRARRTISVATLGKSNPERLSERLAALELRNPATPGSDCGLLSGKGDCLNCETPLSPAQQRKVTIQHDGQKTTIARVTCPTDPRFWRWRALPLPNVVY